MRFDFSAAGATDGGQFGNDNGSETEEQNWSHPSPARMFEVASGLSHWTPEEKAWLAMHPRWIEYEIQLRSTLKDLQHNACVDVALDSYGHEPLVYDI